MPEQMTTLEVERVAREACALVGYDPDRPMKMLDLARALLGPSSVQTVQPHALPADGCLVRVGGQPRILVRAGLSVERRRFVLAHELGHHCLSVDSSAPENEDLCDAFAAELVAPRSAYQSALSYGVCSYAELARWFVTTESCVALRLGEVTGVPLALLAPGRIRVRGSAFDWPPNWASAPGIHRTTLRDDRRRVVLRVA